MGFQDVLKQNSGFGSVSYTEPFDNTKLGIAKNTVKGIPSAFKKVGGDILQSVARSFGSAGLSLMGKKELVPESDFQKKVIDFVYGGKEPVRNIQQRVAISKDKIESSTFAKKYGIDKYASPLAFGGVVGGTLLDLTPFGGVEKNAIKTLAKETSESGIVKILSKLGLDDDVVKEFAPKLAKTTDEKEVKEALDIIKNTQSTKNLSKSSPTTQSTVQPKTVQKTLPPELPVLSPKNQQQLSSIDKITQALKEVKPLRGQQEKLYTQERAIRASELEKLRTTAGGEQAYKEQLGKLKGEFGKIDYTPVREALKQPEVDNLFNYIDDSAVLSTWDSITAKRGLVKILDGKIPTNSEIELMSRVFPKDFVDAVMSNRSLWEKFKDGTMQVANIPRAVMSSFDLSAPFRQGLFLINRPKRFFGAFQDMFKSFGSEKAFNELQQSIIRKPTYKLMQENKLALTDMNVFLNKREERFMSSWAESIPGLGRGIKASGRAYTAFLNKLRADVFEDLVLKADKLGVMKESPQLAKEIAKFVNTATGRGSLGGLERGAVALNSFFFSPRLMASRLTLLNPAYYVNASPFVRKEALKSLFTLGAVATTVLTMAKMGGAEVEDNPTSADFGKIKINNTRVDILGGFQQYIVAAVRLATGEYTSTVSGETSKLGEGYKALSRYDIILRQIESKEAPVIGFLTALAKGKDITGKDINIPQKTLDIFTPMTIGALIDLAKEDPQLLPLSALGSFGLGIQTYEDAGKGFGAGSTSSSKSGFGSVSQTLNQGFGQ